MYVNTSGWLTLDLMLTSKKKIENYRHILQHAPSVIQIDQFRLNFMLRCIYTSTLLYTHETNTVQGYGNIQETFL